MNEPNAQGVPLPKGKEGGLYSEFLNKDKDVVRKIDDHQQTLERLPHGEPMDEENRMIAGTVQGSEASAPKIVPFPKEYLTPGQEPVELRPLLKDIVLKVMPVIREKKVRFSFEISGGLPQVRGHSSDLRRAFIDIFRNALDSMPQGGRLWVSVSYFAADGLPERVEVRVEERASGTFTEAPGEVAKPSFTADPLFGERDFGLAIARDALARAGGLLVLEHDSDHSLSFITTLQVYSGTE